MKTIHALDLYSGAGGTSPGLVTAALDIGADVRLTAINHWDVAIKSPGNAVQVRTAAAHYRALQK